MIDDFKTRLAMANYYQEIADGTMFGEAADEAALLVQEDIQAYAQAKLAEMFGEAPASPVPRRAEPPPVAPARPLRMPTAARRPAPVAPKSSLMRRPAPAPAQVQAPAKQVAAPQRTSMLQRVQAAPVAHEEEDEPEWIAEAPQDDGAARVAALPKDREVRREKGQDWMYTWKEFHLDQVVGDSTGVTDIPVNDVMEVDGRTIYRASVDTWWWIRKRAATQTAQINPATRWDKDSIEYGTATLSAKASATGSRMSFSSSEDAHSRDLEHP